MTELSQIATRATGSSGLSFDIADAAWVSLANHSVSVPIVGFLTGIVLMLYLSYIYGTHGESRLLRVVATIVALCSLLDFCLSIAVNTARLHYWFSKNPAYTMRISKLSSGQAATTVTTVVIAQCYFGQMVYRATKSSRLWLGIAVVLIICTLGGGIANIWTFHDMSVYGPPEPHSPRGLKALGLYLVSSTAMAIFDLIVTLVLCRIFFSSKRKATFGNTKNMLTYLLVTTLETFSLTTAVAIATVILEILPLFVTGLWLWRVHVATTTMAALVTRVYAISFLYTLNRRAPLRARFNQPSNPSPDGGLGNPFINDFSIENGAHYPSGSSGAPANGVRVQTEVLYASDSAELSSFEKKQRARVTSEKSDFEVLKFPTRAASRMIIERFQ